MNFKLKLEELAGDEEAYARYYNDNSDEIRDVENKLQEFCNGLELNIKEYNVNNLKKLVNTLSHYYLYNPMKDMRQELISSGDDFKITREFAEKYRDILGTIARNSYIYTFTDEQKNILKKALVDYLKIYEKDLTVDNLNEYDIHFLLSQAGRTYEKLERMEICNEKIQNSLNNSHTDELRAVAEKYIQDNNIQPLRDVPEGVDVGNGLFDRVSTQKTENCWAHAGINSLLASETGKKLIENNYYRDAETGIITIHLQEAEDLGLHGGIYVVTPQEIIDSQETLASGEGEISAYIIAIQKYFDEVNANPDLKNQHENKIFNDMDEGNAGFRFYEVITGGEYTEWGMFDDDAIKVNKGIGISTSFDMNDIYRMVENGQGAVTISLRGIAHNISVVGVKDNKFLIQESNNSETIFDNHVGVDDERIFTIEESIDGRPTYGLSIETANKYSLGAVNYIKWE